MIMIPYTTNKLEAGETLHPGDELTSNNLIYHARFLKNGDFCLVLGDDETVWSINKQVDTPTGLVMQGDGNLVAYCYENGRSGNAYWATHSSGSKCHLELGDDGRLAIVSENGNVVSVLNPDYKGQLEAITVDSAVYTIESAKLGDPRDLIGERITLKNDSDTEETSASSVSIEASQSSTWSKTVGGSASITVGGKAGIPFVEEGKVSVTASIDFHYQWGSTQTVSKTFSASVSLTVPPHKIYWATLVGQSTKFSCDYTMTGTVTAGGVTRPWKYSGRFEGENGHDWTVHYGEDGSSEPLAVIPAKVTVK